MPKSAKDVIAFAKENKAVMVDLKFCDFLGIWQHVSVPMSELDGVLENGQGFDGSSIRGWQPIHASDMLLRPDFETMVMDPVMARPTMSLICDIIDPITNEAYSRDPRNIAKKAVAYLQSTGIGDMVFFGPEAEFFVFDDVRYHSGPNHSFHKFDSVEATWNSGREENPNLGYKVRHKEGYFPVAPTDTLMDLRTEMCLALESVGIRVETQHHEVATAGQCEIDMRFDAMVPMADKLMWFKYIVKNVARKFGKTVTFMPKPMYGDNGSGMHCHQSIWKKDKPLFAGNGYGGLSDMAMHYIGGILKHGRAVGAFTNPSTNSYKRLVPGFEAPVNLAYSSRNRSASIRIPMANTSPKAKRLELRFPDPSCNGYIAFAAMLMAGLDGVENKMDPGDPLDKDIYALSPEELANVPTMPGSLTEAFECLKADHKFLLKGNVFTQDVLDIWVEWKIAKEILPVQMRPHPLEFELYYDC